MRVYPRCTFPNGSKPYKRHPCSFNTHRLDTWKKIQHYFETAVRGLTEPTSSPPDVQRRIGFLNMLMTMPTLVMASAGHITDGDIRRRCAQLEGLTEDNVEGELQALLDPLFTDQPRVVAPPEKQERAKIA
jgi:hypothetical protein